MVKVGFMHLRVMAAQATPGDFKPDAYVLANAAADNLNSDNSWNAIIKGAGMIASKMGNSGGNLFDEAATNSAMDD